MPLSVQQRGIGGSAVAWRVHNDHEADCHSPEYIKGKRTLGGLHGERLMWNNHIDHGPQTTDDNQPSSVIRLRTKYKCSKQFLENVE